MLRELPNLLPPRRYDYRHEFAIETFLFAPLTRVSTVILRSAANLVQAGSEPPKDAGTFFYLPSLAVGARTWSRRIVKEG